ncbi:MAG: hypothetical protein A3F72_05825 [Bacteroidetes bacterium RIFCSPLOWO2_12_FULL_35_15]|nr:MAG: hypothetical protein A3F72_05825 [Bacteroidetes bacterium RIFCSPLOWO2_12_FULL_35_15]
MKKVLVTISVFLITLITVAQNIYTLDKNHTKVGFSATHFGISHVEGRFKNITATLKAKKEDFTDAVIEMTADVKSIDTDIELRDNDLRSEKWFDVAKYPTLTFKSTSFKKISGKNYKLEGILTIHGISKPISLNVVYNGRALNPITKKSSVGFTITGKLDRKDFLIGTGAGNSVVSNEIELKSNAEFIID